MAHARKRSAAESRVQLHFPVAASAQGSSAAADPSSVVIRTPENSATTGREKCASNRKRVSLHSVIEKASFLRAPTTPEQPSDAREMGPFPLLFNVLFVFLVRFPGPTMEKRMPTKHFLSCSMAAITIILYRIGPDPVWAQTMNSVALTGHVSSHEEGSMEGVLVTATGSSSTPAITVVSDEKGQYSFSRTNLEPGQYSLRTRAVGYDIDDPGPVQVSPARTATVDLNLHKAKNFSSQLSNGEWLLSFPGTQEQKLFLIGCLNCHTLERVAKSSHDPDEWMEVYRRMSGYAMGSQPARPQPRPGGPPMVDASTLERRRKLAEWMATINSSTVGTWPYPVKTLPRPKGRGTHVVITEYPLPPLTMPHDMILDSKGIAWYTDFGQQHLGRLDPKTAKVEVYDVPKIKPNNPTGSLDVEEDKEGNLWLGMLLQGGLTKFDTKTHTFTTWKLPDEFSNEKTQVNMVMPFHSDVDGKVWVNGDELILHRLDPASGKFETFDLAQTWPPDQREGHIAYAVLADSHNNGYMFDFGVGSGIGRVDAKTGEMKFYPTPTPLAAPRRGKMDSQERIWFGEYRGGKLGMFDTKTGQYQEWDVPTPWFQPYDAELDKNGDVWTASMVTDRVLRFNPKTGQFTEYLLPRETNVRRVFVDNSTTPPSFWVGNNHGAEIIKLQPLD